MEHDFTPVIKKIISRHFGEAAEDLFEKSPLLQYINLKTVSATRGSKARSSFANLYAIYTTNQSFLVFPRRKLCDKVISVGAALSRLAGPPA